MFDCDLLAAYCPVSFSATDQGTFLSWYHVSDPRSPCQQLHLSILAEFLSGVQHRSGDDNAVVVFPIFLFILSCLGIVCDALTDAQHACPDFSFSGSSTSLQIQDCALSPDQLSLARDVSLRLPCHFVPASLFDMQFFTLFIVFLIRVSMAHKL